jgi:hypothetical protein
MQYTNKMNLPEPVVLALTHDTYSRGKSNRSVTQLIDSARAQILRTKHDDDIVEDVSDLIWIALGKAVHLLLEKHARGKYLPEERLFAELGGWTISGQVDIQYDETVTLDVRRLVKLIDYKCTSVWSVIFGKEDWHNQLNFYAWLAEEAKDVRVTELQVLVILRDWKKSELKQRGKDYPASPIMLIDIPLWTKEKRDWYVNERVKVHQNAEFLRLTGDTLPFCTDAERWKNPAKYAVIKTGNKRAQKVLDTQVQAEEYIAAEGTEYAVMKAGLKRAKKVLESKELAEEHRDELKEKWPEEIFNIEKRTKGLVIEERPSIPKRCADEWCKAAPWCDQWLSEQKGELI